MSHGNHRGHAWVLQVIPCSSVAAQDPDVSLPSNFLCPPLRSSSSRDIYFRGALQTSQKPIISLWLAGVFPSLSYPTLHQSVSLPCPACQQHVLSLQYPSAPTDPSDQCRAGKSTSMTPPRGSVLPIKHKRTPKSKRPNQRTKFRTWNCIHG